MINIARSIIARMMIAIIAAAPRLFMGGLVRRVFLKVSWVSSPSFLKDYFEKSTWIKKHLF